ncbi:Tigger transposable element-derived protein 4 [Araneus ventricosus]|uniref:Tigger transposable element-derived protein 4 n=1 Tax=Araneus ventricosus TaxID=182803 RepID=A0A4Y2EHB1_ARAVE|nr:Tigger transposable element-derived protein 4 [Araneus ventricosus]
MKKNLNGCKRLPKAEKENVKEASFKWFALQSRRNFPITGAILQAKANEFAELFEEKIFVCSNGWLDRVKKRHNIRCGKVVGEAASACSSDINHWMENAWPDIIRNYNEKDIFNADEAGLFYKLTPNQTLNFKGEKCVGGKLSKPLHYVLEEALGRNPLTVDHSDGLRRSLHLTGIPPESGLNFPESRNRIKMTEETKPVVVSPAYQQLSQSSKERLGKNRPCKNNPCPSTAKKEFELIDGILFRKNFNPSIVKGEAGDEQTLQKESLPIHS